MVSAEQLSIAQEKTDVANLATGVSISLIGKIAGRGIFALGQIVLARVLGPAAFGLYAIGWSIFRVTQATVSLGLHNGVIQFGSRYQENDRASLRGVLLQSLAITLAISLFVAGVFFLAAGWIESVFKQPGLAPVIRGFAVAVPLAAGLKVTAAATRISQRMEFSAYAEDAGQPAISLALVLVFFLLGWRLAGAVAADVISFGIAFALALFFLRRLFPDGFSFQQETRFHTRELILFSLPTTLIGVFAPLVSWADRLFMGYFRPATEVGVYQAVAQASILFTIILRGMNLTMAPIVADLYHKNEMERLEGLFRIGTKWGLYLSLPLFLVICFVPRALITVAFGLEYTSGVAPLVILAVGQLINVATGAVGIILVMTGHQNRWLVLSGLALAAAITLHWLLIPRLGMTGAALSTSITTGGLYLAGLVEARRTIGLWPYDRRYVKLLLATALATAALVLLHLSSIASPALNLLLAVGLSAGIVFGTLFLLGLDTEDRHFISMIRRRLERNRRPA